MNTLLVAFLLLGPPAPPGQPGDCSNVSVLPFPVASPYSCTLWYPDRGDVDHPVCAVGDKSTSCRR